MWITDWTARAACKGTDPDELFVQGAAQNRAKLICRGCPVRTECLADALDNRIEFGVWGGMTERERRALLRRRPDVTSWRDLLEDARNKYERTGDELVARLPAHYSFVIPKACPMARRPSRSCTSWARAGISATGTTG
jgi:WhiB family transcriptional regulator, redox-sensing transcriptional regulator